MLRLGSISGLGRYSLTSVVGGGYFREGDTCLYYAGD